MMATTISHARLIDRLQFASECFAVRERAIQQLRDRHDKREAQLQSWLRKAMPVRKVRPVLELRNPIPAASEPVAPFCVVKSNAKAVEQIEQERDTTPKPGPRPRKIAHDGLSLTTKEWAAHLGVPYSTLLTKVHRLGSIEAALASLPRQINQLTGGYETTSQDTKGTGGGRHARHLHGVKS